MHAKSLEDAILEQLAAQYDDATAELVKNSFEEAAKRRAEFEKRRQEINKEIERGTRRSSGKLPI